MEQIACKTGVVEPDYAFLQDILCHNDLMQYNARAQ